MFPGINGFHWTLGHILFLALFFAVVLTVITTVASAAWHTAKDFRDHRAFALCWKEDFSALSPADRRCRHELAGRVISRTCDHQFDCRSCTNYPYFAVLPATGFAHDLGLDYPADRFYHRGHTWVKPTEDGTVTIGLDALADHVIGDPDLVRTPQVGNTLEVNQIMWRIRKNGHEVLVRAPLEGTVISTGNRENRWTLQLRPRLDLQDPRTLRHLLRGPEVHGWVSRELERLQLQLRPRDTMPALADGGVLIRGLMDALPNSDWGTALADTFLEV